MGKMVEFYEIYGEVVGQAHMIVVILSVIPLLLNLKYYKQLGIFDYFLVLLYHLCVMS